VKTFGTADKVGSAFAIVGKRDDVKNTCVVAFKGSSSTRDFLEDLSSLKLIDLGVDDCAGCKVGDGIKTSYDSVKDGIKSHLRDLKCSAGVAFTGHSLGAAQAVLAMFDLKGEFKIQTSYTFGQPVIGNSAFHNAFRDGLSSTELFRIVHRNDAVPHFGPFEDFGLSNKSSGLLTQHQGTEIFYEDDVSRGPAICEDGTELESPSCSYSYFKANTGVDVLGIHTSAGIASNLARLFAAQANPLGSTRPLTDHLSYLDQAIAGSAASDNCVTRSVLYP
jgi:hypothetical protein